MHFSASPLWWQALHCGTAVQAGDCPSAFFLCSFVRSAERFRDTGVIMAGEVSNMVGKDYFARQALTLLKLARVTSDPNEAAALAKMAAQLQVRHDDVPAVPDVSPPLPDSRSSCARS